MIHHSIYAYPGQSTLRLIPRRIVTLGLELGTRLSAKQTASVACVIALTARGKLKVSIQASILCQ